MATQKGLGKGLGALFGDINEQTETPAEGAVSLPLQKIEPNPLQPRKTFDPDELASLAESIRMHGIIQPLTVRKLPSGFYQIIAGERRWRAARLAGLSDVPVVIIEADDKKAMELALIENLQRADLNPIEEALGYQARIVETARGDADRFSALQSQYARAPEVTRDRLYVDTVRDVMKNVTKVYVDAKGGNNLLYLPLDKIVNNTKSDAMTQAQKEAAALADHGVTAAQSAVETTGSAQPTTSSAAPGDEYQRMLRDRR